MLSAAPAAPVSPSASVEVDGSGRPPTTGIEEWPRADEFGPRLLGLAGRSEVADPTPPSAAARATEDAAADEAPGRDGTGTETGGEDDDELEGGATVARVTGPVEVGDVAAVDDAVEVGGAAVVDAVDVGDVAPVDPVEAGAVVGGGVVVEAGAVVGGGVVVDGGVVVGGGPSPASTVTSLQA